MTIHGPSSDNYEEAIRPTLITDWLHESAFRAWWKSIEYKNRTYTFGDNILVNGSGTALGDHTTPPKYQLLFKRVRPSHANPCIVALTIPLGPTVSHAPHQHLRGRHLHLLHR